MKQEFFTVIPQNMREYKMSIREADNENDLFRMAFDEVMKDHGLNTDGYMLAWDSFKDGWEAAVRLLNDDGEKIDGRTAGTAPECTQPMLEEAMKAAVANKLLPMYADEGAYLRNWDGMKACINAALAAAPSPQSPAGGEGAGDADKA